MTQITAVNLNNLNTFELYKHYAGLSHSLPLLTPESKQLVLAELEQVARLRSEKMDGIHYALTNHEQLIATGKEEKKLLDAAIKHHEAEVKGLRGILERLHQLGCIEDNKLVGKNYQFSVSPLPELALEVSKPVEEWDNEDKEAYAMVEEVTTTTIVRSNNGKDILWSDEKIKHKHVPNPDAIRSAHENGQPLPQGVRLIKKYRISRKRILNKQLNQNVE